jgi:hypothetical protein
MDSGLVKEFLRQQRFAVVGSFRNETKVAYKIFTSLTAKGYEVYPVNPGMREVAGRTCYRSITDLPSAVDVVNIVTPPAVTEGILKECLQKGITRAWLQPGAESPAGVQFCSDNNMSVIHGMCVMLESLTREELR